MARSALTVSTMSVTAGVNLTDADAAANVDGNSFANPLGTVMLYADNASGGAIVATFQTPRTVGGGVAIAEQTITIPAGERMLLGPFDKETFNQSTGEVYVDYDGVTSLTVLAIDTQ